MPEIVALLQTIAPVLSKTTLRQMSHVIYGMLVTSGRITMLGLSRWTEPGGSYRTVQRFFYSTLPWGALFWGFFRQHVFESDEVYLLAGDESIVTKAGKQTYGLDRFFSSLYEKAVPGLSFFALALVSVKERRSYPVLVERPVAGQSPP